MITVSAVVLILTMALNDDSDEICDYPKVAMVQNTIIIADENDKNCDFRAFCFYSDKLW